MTARYETKNTSRTLLKITCLVFVVVMVVVAVAASPFLVKTAYAAVTISDVLSAIAWGPLGIIWNHIASPGLSFVGDMIGNAAAGVLAGISFIILQIGFWAVKLAGLLLDATILFSINSDNFRLGSVVEGWEIFRDLANMVFIFILLYIAIATILQVSGFNTKRILVTLIVAALLVNFSFFLSGIVIDASNILTSFFYDAITQYKTATAADFEGIGGVIAGDGLKLPSMFETLSNKSEASNIDLAVARLLGSVFFFVTAFVLFSGAILFVLRTVVLMLLLVVAPLAFVSAILPKTQQYWRMWLGHLVNHSFVAPIYLLLLLVVVKLIQSKEIFGAIPGSETESLAAAVNLSGGGASFKIVLNFIVIIGLMLVVHRVTTIMAGGISKLSVRWAGAGVGLAVGGAALAGRQTLGRIGYGITKSEKLQTAAKQEGAKGFAARLALRTGDVGARATYDVRGEGKFARGVRAVSGATTAGAALDGVGARPDVGKAAKKGGLAERRVEAAERARQRAEVFETKEAKEAYARGQEKVFGVAPLPELVRERRGLAAALHGGAEKAERVRKGKSPEEKLIDAVTKKMKDDPEFAEQVVSKTKGVAPSNDDIMKG